MSRIVAVFEFILADGEVIRHEFTPENTPHNSNPPEWLYNTDRFRVWDNPSDPIKFTGYVKEGYEEHARNFPTHTTKEES